MIVKLVPFKMDKETAALQVSLLVEAYETLADSRINLEELREGQTTSLWTSDGRSVALAKALTERYNSALAWLDAIQVKLNDAFDNLNQAIDETDKLDESQKDRYRAMLNAALGDSPAPDTVEV